MKRREFIRLTMLTSGVIVFNAPASKLYADTAKNRISGRVTSNGKPISGVLLSDGFCFTSTNKKGYYAMEHNSAAQHVFVIVPAGYEFPHSSGIPQFFKRTDPRADINFDLQQLPTRDDQHHFIIWADPQVRIQSDVQELHSQSVPDVIKLKKELGENSLLHGIAVGDLVFDKHNLFPDYNLALKKMDIPFFQAIGNHDMDYNKGGDDSSDATFKHYYGPTYYSFNRGKVHYVVLDNVRYLGEKQKFDGYITEQQLAWLEKDLKYVPIDHLLIINLHIPVYSTVKNKLELYALLKPFKNVHIMSGHTHCNDNNIHENIFEHNHGTVCGGWWFGPVCGDGTPRGYGVYTVNGTSLTWYFKSAGYEKSEQMRIYVDQLTHQKRVLANVWNWDPEWKVEAWADGKYIGAMIQQKGLDPFCVKQNILDQQTPEIKTTPLARNTNHLFIAHTAEDVKSVRVLVTDRFGDTYEKTWSQGDG